MINFYEETQDHLPAISDEEMTDAEVLHELKEIRAELGEKVAEVLK